MKSNRIWIPQVVACLFLLWAFNPDNPYSYYILLRWVVCGVFAYLAYQNFEAEKVQWTWVLGITALVYNPIFRASLEREFWSVVNALTIVVAIVSVFKIRKEEAKNNSLSGGKKAMAITKQKVRRGFFRKEFK